MLMGNWLTMQLNEKDAVYSSGVKQASSSKPNPVNASSKEWQWKFFTTSQSTPDPYALYIYNRSQTAGTKAIDDRFALLSHSAGDYALAKAGRGDYTYQFLNGNSMDASTAATIATESGFTFTSGTFDGTKSQVKLSDEVQHTYTYKVYTNGGVNAINASQSQEDAHSNDWKPVLPEAARTPLLNLDQYRYYEKDLEGTVAENDTLGKSLSTLYGIYEDIVYTHYTPYNDKVSTYLVPNERNATNANPVARGINSNDAPIGLDGKRLYNIYWHDDEIMKSNGTSITSESNQDLKYAAAYEWEFEGDDPYAIKIKNVVNSAVQYIHKSSDTETSLNTEATPFMLLNKEDHTYGVFAITGDASTMLSGHGHQLTTSNPTKFVPFALSTYKVIYHLVIANIGQTKSIPYAELENGNRVVKDNKVINGSTLRDLVSVNGSGGEHVAGDRYQLGGSLPDIIKQINSGITTGLVKRQEIYCWDAGHVSLGDALEVPSEFYRPNVNYDFYIEGVYDNRGENEITEMNNKYKGLKMDKMGEDEGLLGCIVFVNIVYSFLGGLDTNSGSDFVKSVNDNKWYTFETSDATPKLAQYTGSLQTVSGYATHYTNDYLWTPVGDPYGFKMYNRYMYKNLEQNKVMSTTALTTGTAITMVDDDASNPYVPYLPANSVYELTTTSTTTSGYFRISPVVNMHESTKVYMNNNSSNGKMTLSTTATEWTFGLSEDVMRPYYQAAGYVGGLNDAGKAAYETAAAKTNPLEKLMTLQDVVYNHDNDGSAPEHPNYIVHYTPGYYRLHNQPGSSGITTPRYASGYTHKTELTGDASSPIPMHFYEVEEYDVNNPTFRDIGIAGTDYTSTPATRGDIPLVTVDKDPASIFRFIGESTTGVKLSTQGLYVVGNTTSHAAEMTETVGDATSFDIVDIGAGVVALQQNEGDNFLKYDQTSKKFDLKFNNTASTVESARWCMKPVQKGTKAGNGEMGLRVGANNGGDNYYYTTFYAPFDVLLTAEKSDTAWVVPTGGWSTDVMHPKMIGEYNTADNSCPEDYRGSNQFIPAGTPVIIRATSGNVTMALPNATPSDPIETCLSGKYLEQMLDQDADNLVYVLGRSYTHSGDFGYTPGTGVVIPAGLEFDKGVGFYKNANTNRESNETKALWERNNKYVYANKIYYRAEPGGGGSSREFTRGIEFIPVIFDVDVEGDEEAGNGQQQMVGDGCIYDLMGRKVASREQVEDGSWRTQLTPGIYILNGKKFKK